MTEDCTFQYFKADSGKWKYEGRGVFPFGPTDAGKYSTIDRAAIMQHNNGAMPGISGDGSDMIIVVLPDDDCTAKMSYPHMIMPTK